MLKLPQSQCRAEGASSYLSDYNQRLSYCADVRTCLVDDEDGNCQSHFGYCTREQNVWRFDGAECSVHSNSCKSFVRQVVNKTYSYNQYTVDFGQCNANNAGCQWYSERKLTDGTWDTSENKDARIYLNQQAKTCDPKDAGCNMLLRNIAGAGSNLIWNGSFEQIDAFIPENDLDDANADFFYGLSEPGNYKGRAVSDAVIGDVGFAAESPVEVLNQNVFLGTPIGGRTFTLSFYARNCSVGSAYKIHGGTRLDIPESSDWQRYSSSVFSSRCRAA